MSCLSEYYIRPIPGDPEYVQRLQTEYELIERNRFTRVFIQVQKIVALARELQIPFIIRGSAGSSLVCYLLGITHIDPIRYCIELARFMNSARTDLPDIDIDVPYNRRQELYMAIERVFPKQVARISNHILYREKSAKKQAERELPGANAVDLASRARELLGTKRTTSLHCGGIVIFEEEGEVPEDLLFTKPNGGDGLSQNLPQIILNKDETESAGFIKIDILSNRALAQLADISERPLLEYPHRDALTERLLARGENIGITFAESRGMRSILVGLQPRHMEDLAIALALIRPAAAMGGKKQEFLERWRMRLDIPDPMKRPIIFDDDAIALLCLALSLTAAEADTYRKAFAKQNLQKCQELRARLRVANYGSEFIEQFTDDLNQLSYYSFCKSHAISYAQIVWALAYWKAHRPHEFWIAALNHCHSEYRQWVHRREAICAGLTLSRAPPPYRLGVRNGLPAAIPISVKEQATLLPSNSPKQMLADMREHGVWFSHGFLPGCYLTENQTTLDGKIFVEFCGLIATGRLVRHTGQRPVVLVCIGVANKRYIDLVIGAATSAILGHTALRGKGILTRRGAIETVEVVKIRGVSLEELFLS